MGEEEEFSCEAEVNYFHVVFYNKTDQSHHIGSGERWWCNVASVSNFIAFVINFSFIFGLLIWFVRGSKNKSPRQVLAEETWACVVKDETEKVFRIKSMPSTNEFRGRIAQKKRNGVVKSPKKNNQTSKINMSKFDPVYSVLDSSIAAVPTIYYSPVINCVFTTGSMDRKTDEYVPAKFDGDQYCGKTSNVSPWVLAQRVAADPEETQSYYKGNKLRFDHKKMPCLESIHGYCEICNADVPRVYTCHKPRTWAIGQCLYFANPKTKDEDLVKFTKKTVKKQSEATKSSTNNAQVAPESTTEEKTRS